MFTEILVPLDGSARAERAAATASELSAMLGIPWLVYRSVLEENPGLAVRMSDRLTDLGHGPSRVIVELGEHPAHDIVRFADRFEHPLICMSTHGNGGVGRLIGTATEHVVRNHHGPVLTVGPEADPTSTLHLRRFMVCVDGSTFSTAAAEDAATWIAATDGEPWVIGVLRAPSPAEDDVAETAQLRRVAQRLRLGSAPPQWDVLHHRSPATALVAMARDLPASIIVLSTHGRSGLHRIAFGSVALAVASKAPCPVLLRHPVTIDLTEPVAQVDRATTDHGVPT